MRRILGILVFALLLLVGALAGVAWLPLRQARAEWRAGRAGDAITRAERWSRLRLWPRQYRQFLAAAHLSVGRRADADRYLDGLRNQTLWVSVLPKAEVANKLFARGRYEDFLAYDSAVRQLRERRDTALYRAAAQLSANRVKEAEATFRSLKRSAVDPDKYAALERALHDRRGGVFPVAVDRNGQVIAAYSASNDDIVAVNTDFAAFVEKEGGSLTIESIVQRIGTNERIATTLDAAVQRAAMRALGGFRSSLVAIDPKTNEILAVASHRGDGPLSNLAIEHQYEPGSVMKTLTGLAALEHNVKLDYPYTCGGALNIDGRSFGDWREDGHGQLKDFDEALAQSCNVVFADYGVRLGRDRLRATLGKAGFDGRALNLGLFQAPLGKTEVAAIFNNFETAFYAIGLEHESATTLHLAMLASMLANRGKLTVPRIYTGRHSILGEVVDRPPRQTSEQIAKREHVQEIVQAMHAVTTRPLGTGRRAVIAGLPMALKTGTAGKEEDGYHAVIIGFAPVDDPKIAFALMAEGSGPAEFAAAKIAHDFLTAIRARL